MFLGCPGRRFSIRCMLGPRGNPQARNLFEIIAYLQHAEGVGFEVRSTGGFAQKARGTHPAKKTLSCRPSHNILARRWIRKES
jgi:hypothetical protein